MHEPCPPMSHFLDKGELLDGNALMAEDGDQSDDDEFEMGGQTQTFKCPITLMTLENAVTSESCKHSYTKAAVINLIESGRGRATCPVAGCDKILTMATLKVRPATDKADGRRTICCSSGQMRMSVGRYNQTMMTKMTKM